MTQPTDTQLKQALAKMLPEQLVSIEDDDQQVLCYICKDLTNKVEHHLPVLDTELLHLCWMVEETIKRPSGCMPSLWYLELRAASDNNEERASWQQRTIALCKVKGVEIV